MAVSPFQWVSQYYIGFFFAYGVYLPFWSLWFDAQGASLADIGVLVGIGLATRCVANLMITPRVHQAEHLLPVIRVISFFALLFIALHFFVGGYFWLMALATVLFNLCCGPAVPLSDAMANYYSKQGKLDYGCTRLWGSVAFIGGSTVVGYLVAWKGTDMIVYTALVGVALSLGLSLRNIQPMPCTQMREVGTRPKLTQLLCEWPVVKFLVLVALIQGSHAAYYAFSTLYWKEAGHSEEVIGYLWSLGVAAEVCAFAFSRRAVVGWSLKTLFMIAALGVILRWGLTASTTALAALVVIQLMHGITFALAHVAAIQYIQQAPQSKMVVLQALYNAIPLGAVIALVTTLSGWGYAHWGAGVFWAMAVMGLLALAVRIEPLTSSSESTLNTQANV